MAVHQQAPDAPDSLDRPAQIEAPRVLDLRGVRRVALLEDQYMGMVGAHGTFRVRRLPALALEVLLVGHRSRNGCSFGLTFPTTLQALKGRPSP
jgi:hypothetical protein